MYKRSNMVKGGSSCIGEDTLKVGNNYKYSGSSYKKQKGGMSDYPFESQYNEFSLPPKVSGAVNSNINTNYVSNNDMFGCLEQKGGNMKLKKNKQVGGDCGCAGGPIMLGGSKGKKQTGRGYGYEMNIQGAITNRPEVLRYSTEGTGYIFPGATAPTLEQRGGSMASNNLMEYFLNFQTRCRGTEIY